MIARRRLAASAIVLLAASAAHAAETRDAVFGEKAKLDDSKNVPLEKVLADVPSFEGKYIRVSGTIAKVCENRGCWLSLADASGKELFVKFTCPIEGRLIPTAARGHEAVVEGTLEVAEVTEEHARHVKEESGASKEEVAKIVGPQKEIRLASPAAVVKAMPVEAPPAK